MNNTTPPAQSRDDAEVDEYGLDEDLRLQQGMYWRLANAERDDSLESSRYQGCDKLFSAYRAEIDRLRGEVEVGRHMESEIARGRARIGELTAQRDETMRTLESAQRLAADAAGIADKALTERDALRSENARLKTWLAKYERSLLSWAMYHCNECGRAIGSTKDHAATCDFIIALAPAASATETEERTNAK